MNKTYFKTKILHLQNKLCVVKKRLRKEKYDIKDVDKDKLLIVGKSEKSKRAT